MQAHGEVGEEREPHEVCFLNADLAAVRGINRLDSMAVSETGWRIGDQLKGAQKETNERGRCEREGKKLLRHLFPKVCG